MLGLHLKPKFQIVTFFSNTNHDIRSNGGTFTANVCLIPPTWTKIHTHCKNLKIFTVGNWWYRFSEEILNGKLNFLCSALLTKSLLLKLFNMLKMSLQELQFWLWPFNLGKIFCLCLKARNFKIFSTIVGWFIKDRLSKQIV